MPKARSAGIALSVSRTTMYAKMATAPRANAPVTSLKTASPKLSARSRVWRLCLPREAISHLEAALAGDHVERLLRDLAGVVSGAFQVAGDQDVVRVDRDGARVLHHV